MITVKGLIKQLQQADPEAPVILMLNGTIREVTGITEHLCWLQLSMVAAPIYACEITYNDPTATSKETKQ